jgi:hypothetical protein
MEDSPFYVGEWLNFQTISDQADQFVGRLTDSEWNDFVVAATILENSLRSGRPPSGRAERVEGSRVGLWELKITPPGRRGPQLRVLYIRERRTILCAWGCEKRRSAIPRRAVTLAEGVVKAWRRNRGRR